MEFFCDQFWFCSAMPPEWHWLMPLGMPLLLIIIVAVPVANILHRAGRRLRRSMAARKSAMLASRGASSRAANSSRTRPAESMCTARGS
jgi:hypothetical protein